MFWSIKIFSSLTKQYFTGGIWIHRAWKFKIKSLYSLFFFSWNDLHKISFAKTKNINFFKHLLMIFCQQFHVTVIYFRCRENSSVRTSTNCKVSYKLLSQTNNFPPFHRLVRSYWERRGKRLRFSALPYPQ